jgi:serine/threonine-protein kinase
MAIGMAADRLFEDLPKDVRKSFAELPDVLRTLEAHAEQSRARVKELDRVLHDVEHDDALARRGGGVAADRRESLAGDVRRARDAAESRLSEVVAALETIRLELLRMHAGIGSVESMTADLSSARSLSEDLERLVQGGREVDALLGIGKPEKVGDTPTPQPA